MATIKVGFYIFFRQTSTSLKALTTKSDTFYILAKMFFFKIEKNYRSLLLTEEVNIHMFMKHSHFFFSKEAHFEELPHAVIKETPCHDIDI
jgi:hypothetical protein